MSSAYRLALFPLAVLFAIILFLFAPGYNSELLSIFKQDSLHLPCLSDIQRQREVLLHTFRIAFHGTTHVAVVNYPDHPNKGDAAIWVGEMTLLEALGIQVTYICSKNGWEYKAADVISSFGDVPPENTAIVMHGGGNLGDLYWENTEFVMRVVKDFPDRKTRFFPQTVSFTRSDDKKRERLATAQEVFGGHRDLEFAGRDTLSYDSLLELFPNNPVHLTPDAAFMIGYNPASPFTPIQLYDESPSSPHSYTSWYHRNLTIPIRDVTIMARGDGEGGQNHRSFGWQKVLEPYTSLTTDWILVDPDLSGLPRRQTYSKDGSEDWKQYWDGRALRRVEWAFQFLAEGRFLIADRLHAHILSTMLGIGHILVESGKYAKIKRYQDTWLDGCLVDQSAVEAAMSGQLEDEPLSVSGFGDRLAVFMESEAEAAQLAKAWLGAESRRDHVESWPITS